MKKSFLILSALLIATIFSSAQTKHWQWAKTGGATDVDTYRANLGGESASDYFENVKFIETDHLGNTYFAGMFSKGNFGNDTIITRYSFNPMYLWASRNCVIFALDCEGRLKWYYPVSNTVNNHHSSPDVKGFGIDSLGGIYVSMHCDHPKFGLNPIDTTVDSYNNSVLLKLDTLGNFQWVKTIDLIDSSWYLPFGLSVEPDGTIHQFGYLNNPRTNLYNGLITIDSTTWAEKDMLIIRYDADGNYLAHVSPPVKSLYKPTASNVRFKYDNITSHYYIYGSNWQSSSLYYESNGYINGDTIWGDHPDYDPNYPEAYLDKSDQSYIAAFDYNGEHLWHNKSTSGIRTTFFIHNNIIYSSLSAGNYSQCRSLGIDEDGMLHIAIRVKNFGNFQTDSVKERIIKMEANTGNIEWTFDYPNDTSFFRPLINTARYGKVAVMGRKTIFLNINGVWHTSAEANINQLFLDELNAVDGSLKSRNIWQSTAEHTGSSADKNIPVSITTDRWGNYIIGGVVGTRFYLEDSTIILDNTSTEFFDGTPNPRDAQMFIGKFGAYDCNGQEIDPEVINHIDVVPGSVYNSITVFPNPTTDILNIDSKEDFFYKIFSLEGKLVQAGSVMNSQIGTAALPSAAYLLELENRQTGTKHTAKFGRK
jgi:hypothetical protein